VLKRIFEHMEARLTGRMRWRGDELHNMYSYSASNITGRNESNEMDRT
jgi:hypothetical protein